jgi:hypothetical protein
MKSNSNKSLLLLVLIFICAGLPAVLFGQSGKNKNAAIISESGYARAIKNFAKLFPVASETSWIREDKTLSAYFLNKGNKAFAVFSIYGDMNYAVTLLDAVSVPEEVKRNIKARYKTYSIFCAREIINDDLTMYEVVLENDTEFRVVQTTLDEVIETNKIIK